MGRPVQNVVMFNIVEHLDSLNSKKGSRPKWRLPTLLPRLIGLLRQLSPNAPSHLGALAQDVM